MLDKDFTIDLTQVSDASLEPVPPGLYDAVVDDVEFRESQAGNPVLAMALAVEVDGTPRKVFTTFVLNNEIGLSRLKRAVQVLAPEALTNFRPTEAGEVLIGKECRVRVRQRRGKDGQVRAEVSDFLPPTLDF